MNLLARVVVTWPIRETSKAWMSSTPEPVDRPLQVRRVLQDAVVRVRPANLRVRLLAHHGLGLVNALVAMKSGVRRFDTGAGSVPAQDLRQLADQLGVTVQPSQGSI